MTLENIRKDLKDIRYYYSQKETFDKMFKNGATNTVAEKALKYADALKDVEPRLLHIYYGLYVEDKTQESFVEELGYTPEYIRLLNKKLVNYLYLELNKKAI